MCENCFESNIMGFPTQDDFDNFIHTLDEKIKTNKMRFNDSLENTKNILGIDFGSYATCNSCREDWVLEIPDNAERGYFLNKEGIETYYENKDKQNRRVKRNGLIILVIILILTIYKCT